MSRRNRTRPPRALIALLLPIALLLAACGGSDDEKSSSGSGSFSPVTISHAFGSTTVSERPERVATWGWGSGDAAIALGVVPVAMPKNSFGAEPSGLMPWQAEALRAKGAQTPALLTETETPPFEEIAKARPQVILATYSGITQQDYDTLSKIAPTIAYPGQPWSTPWREVITTTGQVLGKSAEAQKLVGDMDARVKDEAAKHPEFQGKTIVAVVADERTFYVYRQADPRVQFLEDLGFKVAPSVDQLGQGAEGDSFYYTLSFENLDKLTSDVLLHYAYTPEAGEKFKTAPQTKPLPQIAKGTVATVVGEAKVSSVSPPTALSLTWSLDDIVTQLSGAAKKV